MTRVAASFLLCVLLMLAGCATAPSVVSDRLFFGRGIPGGGEVSEAQWKAFVAEVITPRFPEGYSLWRGAGYWRGDDGKPASEESCVFEVTHQRDAATDAKLAEIAKAYRERFNQDAVLLVRTPAEMTFWRR
jgi:hypothetical protein